jgi:hypothetical protein
MAASMVALASTVEAAFMVADVTPDSLRSKETTA